MLAERIQKFNKNTEKIITLSSDENDESHHRPQNTATNDTIQIPQRVRRKNLIDSYNEGNTQLMPTTSNMNNQDDDDDDDILLLEDEKILSIKPMPKSSDEVIVLDEKEPVKIEVKTNEPQPNDAAEDDEDFQKWLIDDTFSDNNNDSKSVNDIVIPNKTAVTENFKVAPVAIVKPFNASVEKASSSKYFNNESSTSVILNQTSDESVRCHFANRFV